MEIREDTFYRALGMAVALIKHRDGAKIPDESKVWERMIRTHTELSDEQIAHLQEAASSSLKPKGSVTSDAT